MLRNLKTSMTMAQAVPSAPATTHKDPAAAVTMCTPLSPEDWLKAMITAPAAKGKILQTYLMPSPMGSYTQAQTSTYPHSNTQQALDNSFSETASSFTWPRSQYFTSCTSYQFCHDEICVVTNCDLLHLSML